jgi:hypothetical protein
LKRFDEKIKPLGVHESKLRFIIETAKGPGCYRSLRPDDSPYSLGSTICSSSLLQLLYPAFPVAPCLPWILLFLESRENAMRKDGQGEISILSKFKSPSCWIENKRSSNPFYII